MHATLRAKSKDGWVRGGQVQDEGSKDKLSLRQKNTKQKRRWTWHDKSNKDIQDVRFFRQRRTLLSSLCVREREGEPTSDWLGVCDGGTRFLRLLQRACVWLRSKTNICFLCDACVNARLHRAERKALKRWLTILCVCVCALFKHLFVWEGTCNHWVLFNSQRRKLCLFSCYASLLQTHTHDRPHKTVLH